MASSRRPGRAEPDPVEALRATIAPLRPEVRIAVAFSGGLDSTVLLHAAAAALDGEHAAATPFHSALTPEPALPPELAPLRPPGRLVALHVDHGLQPASAAWAEHCRSEAASLGVPFATRRLAGAPGRGESIEAWAREARYAALADLARGAGATVLMTAHHADDQIETFLLRLSRGAGLDGLVGIEADSEHHGLRLIRPFLGLRRSALEGWARARALRWIEDPSNADESLPRNAVRRRLLPEIDRLLPGLRQRLPDTLEALREARELLGEVEKRDLSTVAVHSRELGLCLSLSGWRMLPRMHRPGVLRRWLAARGARMPSRARLVEFVRQLESPREDTQVALRHDGRVLSRYRDLVALVPEDQRPAVTALAEAVPIRWTGQGRIDCPTLGGSLLVERIDEPGRPGLRADILRASDLALRPRSGGERLRVRPDAPHRSLKNLFQEGGVPAWLRRGLPVLWSGGRVVWVPRLGADAESLAVEGERYRLDWRPLRHSENRQLKQNDGVKTSS